MLLPDLIALVPSQIRDFWYLEITLACHVVYAIARRWAGPGFDGQKSAERARVGLKWVDRFADLALQGGLTGAWPCFASDF